MSVVIRTARQLTFTVEEVADLLGISRAGAYNAVRSGEIPSVRIGRRVLVRAGWVSELLGVPVDELWRLAFDGPTVRTE